MATSTRKIKLTKLLELLRQESDIDNPLTTNMIIEKMAQVNVSINRRNLADDIQTLNDQGFEIMQTKVGIQNAYYVEDRGFSVPELKIMIDAVQAASFVTPKKAKELISKIAALGGSHRAEILESNMVLFNTRKHSNEQIFYNVDAIETALLNQSKIIFYYYDLDENKKKIYRKDHHHYVIEPISLVFLEDNYYVMAYDSRFDSVANYRVDRMEQIEVIDEKVSEAAIAKINVAEYTERTFKMYNGKVSNVTMEFEDTLITSVYDKFGEGIQMLRTGDHTCVTNVKVNVSPTFFGWVFQFGDKLRILSPDTVLDEYKEHYKKASV